MSFSGWREVKLGKLLNFRRGHDLPKTKMIAGDIPVVGSNGVIGFHNEGTTKAPCLTVGRSGNIGNPCYINEDCWAHNTSLYIDDFKGNDAKYLYYLLKTLNLGYYGGGSAVPTLNRNHIHPIEVLATINKKEQKAIAKTLSCLDDKIELNNRINKTLEEMAQAIFKSWFVDFEPFQDGEFEDSELGRIPKGWRVVALEDLCTVQNGYAFKSKDYVQKGCNMVRTTNIGDDGFVDTIDLIKLPKSYIDDSKYKKFAFEIFDTVLVMVGASVGKIGIITEKNLPSLQNQNMWRFRTKIESISQIYISYSVKLTNEKVKNWSSGSAREFYRKDSFLKARIIEPTKDISIQFIKLIEPIFNMISDNLYINELLREKRDTLLPKLMSGEIRVPIEEVQ